MLQRLFTGPGTRPGRARGRPGGPGRGDIYIYICDFQLFQQMWCAGGMSAIAPPTGFLRREKHTACFSRLRVSHAMPALRAVPCHAVGLMTHAEHELAPSWACLLASLIGPFGMQRPSAQHLQLEFASRKPPE